MSPLGTYQYREPAMKRLRLEKFFPLFFIMAVGLLGTGLGTAYIHGGFVISSALFSLGGLVCGVVSLWGVSVSVHKFFYGFRHYRRGLLLFLPTLVLLTLIFTLNYFVSQHSIRFDLTRAQQHTLRETTKNILKNLNQHVEIIVFYVGIIPSYIEDLLAEFQKLSPQYISLRIVDPLVEIGYAAQFGSVIKGDEKKVIIQSARERKDIDFNEEPLSEEMLVNTILKVTREQKRVYFLTGHSEYDIDDQSAIGLSAFKELLEQNNSLTKELTLGIQNEIPSDCDILVVVGPQRPLGKADEEIIQRYLEKGGKAVFFIESLALADNGHLLSKEDKLKNPSLNSILNRWGVVVGDDVVVDLENHIGHDVGCPATKNYPLHEAIVNDLDYTFYIRPRSIRLDHSLAPGLNLAPLVKTASVKKSWAETSQALEVKFSQEEDSPGPVTLAAVIWEPPKGEKTTDTKIIIFTDADFVTNNFIGQFSNAELVLNAINWVGELESKVVYSKKTAEIERLDLTSKQFRTMIVILFMMPILIGCGGCLVWWRQSSPKSF